MEAKRTQTYTLHTNAATEYRVKGTSPAQALRDLCELAGLTLASQNGRYGKTTDGQNVAAMTAHRGRVRHLDHGTTRLLHGKEVR